MNLMEMAAEFRFSSVTTDKLDLFGLDDMVK